MHAEISVLWALVILIRKTKTEQRHVMLKKLTNILFN